MGSENEKYVVPENAAERKESREELLARIEKVKAIALEHGSVDGDHHKTWVIDQMMRALTGCPLIPMEAKDHEGKKYSFDGLGESEEYLKFVKEFEGEEGSEEESEWDTGIAP